MQLKDMYDENDWNHVEVYLKHYMTVKKSRIYIPSTVLGDLDGSKDFVSFSVQSINEPETNVPLLVRFNFHTVCNDADVELSDSAKIALTKNGKGINLSLKPITDLFFSALTDMNEKAVKVPVECDGSSIIFKPILKHATPEKQPEEETGDVPCDDMTEPYNNDEAAEFEVPEFYK